MKHKRIVRDVSLIVCSSMEAEGIIRLLEEQTLNRELSAVERWVFAQTLQGKSYLEMARGSSYSAGYLKFVGAKLWGDLSSIANTPITKKNLRWVLRSYLEHQGFQPSSPQTSPTRQASPSDESKLNQSSPFQDPHPLSESSAKLTHQTLHQAGETSSRHASSSAIAPLANSALTTESKQATEPKQSQHLPFLAFPSGPVPLGSPFYVEREIEKPAYGELQTPGCLIRIHGPSKTGKTSLLIRLLKQAKDWDYNVAFVDFQTVDRDIVTQLDSFLRWFCANLSHQLNADHSQNIAQDIQAFWNESLGASLNCTHYLEEVILTKLKGPLVLALNEVNQAMSQPTVMQDILSLLRFWHEQSKHHELWQKLRIVLVYSTECYVPLRIEHSPFNVGFSLRLPPLTLEQVQQLALNHSFSWAKGPQGKETLRPLVKLVGGNPYLVRLALYHLYESDQTIDELVIQAVGPSGPYRNHLQERTKFLEEAPQLALTLGKILEGHEFSHLNAQDIYHLESAGFIHYEGQQIQPSCELYSQFFQVMLSRPNRFQSQQVG